jgi:hypothetical protein
MHAQECLWMDHTPGRDCCIAFPTLRARGVARVYLLSIFACQSTAVEWLNQ